MECPKCQHDNPPKAKFCLECGTKLERLCPACAEPLPDSAKFCLECGHDLSQAAKPSQPTSPSPTSAEGERRQATVLFSDLSGYTAMNEKLDPEEVEGFMSRIKAEAVTIVESYGGSVNQFVGDEVLALFGIPTAHKDDPVRAVRAALELHEMVRAVSPELEARLGRPIRFHTGINTGLIVTNRRDDRDGRIGITGDTVNTGARLKALAPDDAIVVSPHTHRWIADEFATEALAAAVLKGKAAPITPYRIVGALGAGQAAAHAFAGRQAELRQFQGAVDACVESRRGQSILVRGEPGIGKTRLTGEFQRLAAAIGFAVHTGLVLDFGAGKGRDAIRTLVQSLLALPPNAEPEERQAAVQRALGEESIEAEQEAYLNDLLEVPQPEELRAVYDAMDNETRNRRKRETVSRLISALSGRQPLLLIVEDIHWADGVTLAHLAELAATVAESPALLAMTTRVQGDPVDRAWRQSVRDAPLMTIDLGPLRPEEAAAMAQAYLEVTAQTAQRCVERAEGNPLFLEQLLLGAEETAETGILGSVQSIVLARVDHLAEGDKEALRAASVLGQRFSLEALEQLIGEPNYDCAPLLANGLIRTQGPEFLFAHALVREGVYDSLLLTRRKALHETAAEWFAERDVELRAAHLDAAGHPDAAQAYLAAAQAQTTKFHFEPALSLAERGLLLAREEGERFSLTCFRGQMLRELGSVAESIEAYRDALPSATDEAGRCRAWIGMASGMRIIDQSEEALKALDQAEAEAEKAGGMTLEKAQLHYIRGSIYWPLGNIVGSLREQESALRFSHEADSPETEALALGGLGDAYYLQGRISTAHEYLKNCFELCRRHAFRRIEAANLGMSSLLRVYLMDLEGGLNDSRAAFELGGKIGHLRADLIGRGVSGYILLQMGDFEPARKFLEDYVRLSAELNAKRQNAFGLIWLSNHALAIGDRGKALELVQRGLAINREVGMRFTGPWSLGILALATDDPETRLRALEEGERLLDADSIAHNHLEFYVHAMQTSLDNGNWEDAERYAAALEEFTRPEPLPWSDFFIARGRALAAFGRGDRSDGICGELRHLRDKAEKVKLRLAIPALDRALASV